MPQTPALMNATACQPAQLSDLVHDCLSRNMPLVDYGQAHQGVGYPPPPRHTRLNLHGGILAHYERDLTLRAAAGACIGQIQAELMSHGQFLPIDADDDLSLGEVIAHHVYGPLRAGMGSIRDHLLGLGYIDGRGRDIRVGGRTVKNVAGYDLTRLMVGSLGELGIIHEATLRTAAVPERTVRVQAEVEDPTSLDAVLTSWLITDATPAWLSLNRSEAGWKLKVGYFGRAAGCAAQVRALRKGMDQAAGMVINRIDELPLQDALACLARQRAWRRKAGALLKLVVPPASTGAACKALARLPGSLAGLNIDAAPVHGCLFVGGDLDAPATLELDQHLATWMQTTPSLRVWHARPENTDSLAPFAPLPPDMDIISRLKVLMDPQKIFNPGRFLARETPA